MVALSFFIYPLKYSVSQFTPLSVKVSSRLPSILPLAVLPSVVWPVMSPPFGGHVKSLNANSDLFSSYSKYPDQVNYVDCITIDILFLIIL